MTEKKNLLHSDTSSVLLAKLNPTWSLTEQLVEMMLRFYFLHFDLLFSTIFLIFFKLIVIVTEL